MPSALAIGFLPPCLIYVTTLTARLGDPSDFPPKERPITGNCTWSDWSAWSTCEPSHDLYPASIPTWCGPNTPFMGVQNRTRSGTYPFRILNFSPRGLLSTLSHVILLYLYTPPTLVLLLTPHVSLLCISYNELHPKRTHLGDWCEGYILEPWMESRPCPIDCTRHLTKRILSLSFPTPLLSLPPPFCNQISLLIRKLFLI